MQGGGEGFLLFSLLVFMGVVGCFCCFRWLCLWGWLVVSVVFVDGIYGGGLEVVLG